LLRDVVITALLMSFNLLRRLCKC